MIGSVSAGGVQRLASLDLLRVALVALVIWGFWAFWSLREAGLVERRSLLDRPSSPRLVEAHFEQWDPLFARAKEHFRGRSPAVGGPTQTCGPDEAPEEAG
jgi:hypothetical protein